MLHPYRRHTRDCPHAAKGQGYSLCDCPIHVYGTLPSGETIRRSLGTRDRSIAAEILRRLEAGKSIDGLAPTGMGLATAVSQYLDDCRARGVRETSIARYQTTLDSLCDFTGPVALAAVDVAILAKFRNQRKGRKEGSTAAPATQRQETTAMVTFFKWCLARKWIQENPALALAPVRGESEPTLPFTDDEVRNLLSAAARFGVNQHYPRVGYYRQRARTFILTLLYTGLRISDAVMLRRVNVDFNTRHVSLRTAKTGISVKVQIPDHVARELAVLPGVHEDFFFHTGCDTASSISKFRTIIAKIGKMAGIHAHPHRFRDTFARAVLDQGHPMHALQALLGHKSIRTTESHYAAFVASRQALLDAATASLDFGERSAKPFAVDAGKRRKRNA